MKKTKINLITLLIFSFLLLDQCWSANWGASFGITFTPYNPDTTPPAAITDLVAEYINGKILLSWTAPDEDGSDAPSGKAVQRYEVKYATSPFTDEDWTAPWVKDPEEPEPSPKTPGNKETMTIESLTPGATYYFAIKSVDDAGLVSPIDTRAGTYEQAKAYIPLPLRHRIWGYVKDTQGNPLKNVKLTLKGQYITTTYITLDDGYFEFKNLESGNYVLLFEKHGWEIPKWEGNITKDTELNFIGYSTEFAIIPEIPGMPEVKYPPVGEVKILNVSGRVPEVRGAIVPAKNEKLCVLFKGTQGGKFTLRIFTLTGELVYEKPIENNTQNAGYYIWEPPKDLPTGVYIVHIEGNGINRQQKVVILR